MKCHRDSQIAPSQTNRLRERSDVMIDKISAVARSKLGDPIGVLSDDDMERVEQALLLVLGIAR